jgi:hypothetical protein
MHHNACLSATALLVRLSYRKFIPAAQPASMHVCHDYRIHVSRAEMHSPPCTVCRDAAGIPNGRFMTLR